MWDLGQTIASSTRTREDADGRVPYALYGVVTNVNDPKRIGRIKARIGAQGDREETGWLMPAGNGALLCKPRVRDTVIVLGVDGNLHRGIYLASWRTDSKNVPTEAMVLGTTMIGLYNHNAQLTNELKAQLNNLRSDFLAHIHSFTGMGSVGSAIPVMGMFTASAVNTANAAKAKAADGSIPSGITSDSQALSPDALVRT